MCLKKQNPSIMLPIKALSLISSFLDPPRPIPALPDIDTANGAETLNKILPENRNTVTLVIFSKDRPGQLCACVESIQKFVLGLYSICILYSSSNETSQKKYEHVFQRLTSSSSACPKIQVFKEHSFHQDLLHILSQQFTCFFLFQVDDAIHYREWDISKGCKLLEENHQLFNIHGKLFKNATICFPSGNQQMRQPEFQSVSSSPYLLFDRRLGSFDWNYPFDLTGGLYRAQDIHDFIFDLSLSDVTIRNPNHFEILGNEYCFQKLFFEKPLSACLNTDLPILSVVTINRVQTEFPHNLIFQEKELPEDNLPWDMLTDQILSFGIDYVKYQYASSAYLAVHVQDLFLMNENFTEETKLDISVLIPCKNAEKTIREALTSVLSQDVYPYHMEIVIVDDASSDASIFLVNQLIREQKEIPYKIRVVCRQVSTSLAACLDFGLIFCNGEFICRMDADDICLPGRIKQQVQIFKTSNYPLMVLGTNYYLNEKNILPSVSIPIGPASVAWGMFFYCTLVHPSVMFSKVVVSSLGNYQGKANNTINEKHRFEKLEDYWLWHRMIDHGCIINNVATFGIIHNKHYGSLTSFWGEEENLLQAEIALYYAKKRATSLVHVSSQDWYSVCRGKRFDEKDVNRLRYLLTGLEELKLSITKQYASCTSKEDLLQVESDFQARLIEIKTL